MVRECLKKIRQEPGGDIQLNRDQNVNRSQGCFGGIKNLFSGFFRKEEKKEEG